MPSSRGIGSISDLKNLFPTKTHFLIFVGYMALFISQGILVTATKDKNNQYSYNTVTVVLLAEFVKLIIAVGLQLQTSTFGEFLQHVRSNVKVLVLYVVPSFMYCLYNNLAFVNLANYDPTTYFLLLQFRVVVTGVIFQILFSKKLSGLQWVSLLLLTSGCIVKQIKYEDLTAGSSSFSIQFDIHLLLILVQVFCSCFAGVYNEYLLKGKGGDVPFMVQNFFMYLDSVLCNFAVLWYNGTLSEAFTAESLSSIARGKVLAIIFNNAGIGITTALFLKQLNSILKTFASALEIMFTALLCWIIFGIPVDIFTFVAIAIVSYAVILYAHNPVDNTPKSTDGNQKSNTSV
ncbi:CMP-sialic acid transporter [Stylophora pistillata]|uniref:CMP-sialic acid transporter n=2 Tax=Stylophora pistillata TaxID=50429 RepID=A0A2B4SDK8_STYPI|nr:CMP-sialic acid transporter [Stylophora pistillata]